MKKRVICTDKKSCMACHSCELACADAFYHSFDPEMSCIRLETDANGDPVLKMCLQCGKCMRACTHKAITQNPKTGVFIVNKKLCTGCGDCREVCPMHVIPYSKETEKVSKCIACGICVRACPMGILEIIGSSFVEV